MKKAIIESSWQQAKNNRNECKYSFQFDDDWNGKRYAIKEVKPIFVEEKDEIIVINTPLAFFN